MDAIDWVDFPVDTKERTVMTDGQVAVPGIKLFGRHDTNRAISPLNPHFHKDCFEFTYIVKGSALFSVGEHAFNLSGGDLFITQMNEIHDTGALPLPLHKMFWMQLDASNPNAFLYLQQDEAATLIHELSHLKAHVITMNETETNNLLYAVFQLFHQVDTSKHRQGAALLTFFLYRVIEQSLLTEFKLTPDIGRAINYVLDNITENIALEQLAKISLLSVSRFKQKFKSQIGSTPREFINSEKVRCAKTLLLEGENITDVAMEFGFSSSSYFSVVFKQFTSFSPLNYVKKSKNQKQQQIDKGFSKTGISTASKQG